MFDLVVMFLCVALVVGALLVATGRTKTVLAVLGSVGAVFFLVRRALIPPKTYTPPPPPPPRPEDIEKERQEAVKTYQRRVRALTEITEGPDASEALAARMGRSRPTEMHGDKGDQ